MKILMLSRHHLESVDPYEFQLSEKGHSIESYSRLSECETNLSDYDAVLAHPEATDLPLLFQEAEKRKEFKLIFFRIDKLKVDPSSQFKNNNVFFRNYVSPSELVEIIEDN